MIKISEGEYLELETQVEKLEKQVLELRKDIENEMARINSADSYDYNSADMYSFLDKVLAKL